MATNPLTLVNGLPISAGAPNGGTAGYVWTSNGASPASFQPVPGTVSAFFVSSQITDDSSDISSTSFMTFSNTNNILTFTPSITGTYKIYSNPSILVNSAVATSIAVIKITNTVGGATLIADSEGGLYTSSGIAYPDISYVQGVFTLTAGTSYSFVIQGKISNISDNISMLGSSGAPFYIFAELIATGSTNVSAKYYMSSTTSLTGGNPINFDTQLWDTNSAVTTGSSWKFTAPVTGKYLVSTVLTFTSYSGTPDVSVYINGTNDTYMMSWAGSAQRLTGITLVNLTAGDYIDIRPDSNITSAVGTTQPYQSSVSITFEL